MNPSTSVYEIRVNGSWARVTCWIFRSWGLIAYAILNNYRIELEAL